MSQLNRILYWIASGVLNIRQPFTSQFKRTVKNQLYLIMLYVTYNYFVASCGCATLSGPIAFSASLSHNIVQLGTQQEILFDQVHLNAGNSYDVRHGNFRVPVDGTYEISVSMLSPGGKWTGVEIVKV